MSDLNEQLSQWFTTQQDALQSFQASMQSSENQTPNQQDSSQLPASLVQLIDIFQRQSESFSNFSRQLISEPDLTELENIDQFIEQFSNYINKQTLNSLLSQWQLPEPFQTFFSHAIAKQKDVDWGPLFKYITEHPFIKASPELVQKITACSPALKQFQHALNGHIIQLNLITDKTCINFKQIIIEQKETPTLAGIHHSWTTVYEKEYKQRLLTEEYQVSYGALTNAMAHLKQLNDQLRDYIYAQFGLPNLAQFDQIVKKVSQQNKRIRQQSSDIRTIQQQLSNYATIESVEQLHTELQQLKQQIAKLQQASQQPKGADSND